MRLLKTDTLDFYDTDISAAPRFAILSHTWYEGEITYQDMLGDRAAIKHKQGFQKVVRFCEQAKASGYAYGWVDTCCIDKQSSAELSETINSMYRYYAVSAVCFIYLADVTVGAGQDVLPMMINSRWFTRGWTLQELIAPAQRQVFDVAWTPITFSPPQDDQAADSSAAAGVSMLNKALSRAAEVPPEVLQDRGRVSAFCVAQRMSWAAKRRTTREEDMAYCLMGLFDVHMPAIYGEGGRKAFRRLQMEIMQSSFDQSLFAWRGPYPSSGLLARSPSDFRCSSNIDIWGPMFTSSFTMTNVGLSVRLAKAYNDYDDTVSQSALVAVIQCDIYDSDAREVPAVGIYLEWVPAATFQVNGKYVRGYRRVECSEWCPIQSLPQDITFFDLLVLEDEHHSLVLQAGARR